MSTWQLKVLVAMVSALPRAPNGLQRLSMVSIFLANDVEDLPFLLTICRFCYLRRHRNVICNSKIGGLAVGSSCSGVITVATALVGEWILSFTMPWDRCLAPLSSIIPTSLTKSLFCSLLLIIAGNAMASLWGSFLSSWQACAFAHNTHMWGYWGVFLAYWSLLALPASVRSCSPDPDVQHVCIYIPFAGARSNSDPNNAPFGTQLRWRNQPNQLHSWRHSPVCHTLAYVGWGYRRGQLQRPDEWYRQEQAWLQQDPVLQRPSQTWWLAILLGRHLLHRQIKQHRALRGYQLYVSLVPKCS